MGLGYNFYFLMRPRRIGALLAWLVILAHFAQAAPASQPNIVFITIDTLRADHLGCYGYKSIRTPNLDALAADSVRFERAYSSVPVTLPSHTVMFTGTLPTLNGMHDFSGNKLGPNQTTLAEILKGAGYSTGAVLGSAVLDSRFGLNRGFDFYYDHFDFSRLQESNLDEMERPGNVVADQALEWLGKNSQSEFFLWMHLYDPHFPYHPPEPFATQYKDRPYDGEIAFADSQVGRLIAFLKQKGLYRNTVIVVTGDHGEGLGEHGEKTHGFFIYNSTLHVPVIVHLPGQSAKAISSVVNLADLMPTLLETVKLPVPGQVQGKSLLPLIAEKPTDPRNLYAETFLPRLHFNWSELRSVENQKYHFIDAPKAELYDLSKDPGETQNLFDQKKAVSEEMRALLARIIKENSGNQEQAEKTGLDPALAERLRSLGYMAFSGGGNPTISNRLLPDPKDRIQTYELISDALSESQHGEFASSAAKLNQAIKTDPDSVAVHYLLGLNYYRMREFPRSIEHLERVMQLSPEYALAAFQLGLAYGRTGDFENAVTSLKRALQLDPTNFAAAYNLGAAYLQQKNGAEATAAFRQCVSIAPDYAAGHRALGEMLLYQHQIDEALTQLRRAAELAPQDPSAHASLAKALSAKGLDAEAEQERQKSQAAHP